MPHALLKVCRGHHVDEVRSKANVDSLDSEPFATPEHLLQQTAQHHLVPARGMSILSKRGAMELHYG